MSPVAPKIDRARYARKALAEVVERGLLLRADNRLKSVLGLVVGKPIRGSWWSHPLAHDIYAVCEALNHHKDLAAVKLVTGKVTYVHRKLWPALVAIGREQAAWQTRGLSPRARALFEHVSDAGRMVRTDQLGPLAAGSRQLEKRLLVASDEVHTVTGAHARVLETWSVWATRMRVGARRPTPESSRKLMEARAAALFDGEPPRKLLPWL